MDTINQELIEHLKKIEPAPTLDGSFSRVLKSQAIEKAKTLRALIRYNETRYGMSVEEFHQQKIKKQDHTWEEEETYFDWTSAHQSLEEMEKEIAALEEIIAHADR